MNVNVLHVLLITLIGFWQLSVVKRKYNEKANALALALTFHNYDHYEKTLTTSLIPQAMYKSY